MKIYFICKSISCTAIYWWYFCQFHRPNTWWCSGMDHIGFIDITCHTFLVNQREDFILQHLHEVWSTYDLIINRWQLVNNVVEGCHLRFQRMTVLHHACTWKFPEHIIWKPDNYHWDDRKTNMWRKQSRKKVPFKPGTSA